MVTFYRLHILLLLFPFVDYTHNTHTHTQHTHTHTQHTHTNTHTHTQHTHTTGIWATLSNERAVQMAYDKIKNLSSFYMGTNSPAQQIVEEAVLLGSGDDQTCLILNLKNYIHTTKRWANANGCHNLQEEDESSPLFQSIMDGLFFSNRGTSLASLLTSSATRPFNVKLAELNRR